MPTPSFIDDTEVSPEDRRRRPAWWRRAITALARTIGRVGSLNATGRLNPEGAYRDLLPRRFGGAGRGGDLRPPRR
jgi:hypothetical protein